MTHSKFFFSNVDITVEGSDCILIVPSTVTDNIIKVTEISVLTRYFVETLVGVCTTSYARERCRSSSRHARPGRVPLTDVGYYGLLQTGYYLSDPGLQ